MKTNSVKARLGTVLVAVGLFWSVVFTAVTPVNASRIKDLTTVEGGRENQLVGYGLIVGGNNRNTTFAGYINTYAGTGYLTKRGTGTLTLTGSSTYAGNTTIQGGALVIGALAANELIGWRQRT